MNIKRLACIACLCLVLGAPFSARAETNTVAEATVAEQPVWTEIASPMGLVAMQNDPAGSYRLVRDLDMGETDWLPFPFSGTLDGGGHTLYNLTVTAPDPVPGKTVDGNHKGYETQFAGLFSQAIGATVENLRLVNLRLDVRNVGNCFAAGMMGYADDATVRDCAVSGRITLYAGGRIEGVGGIAGFGTGLIERCETDVTLVLVDTNREENCEEFLGGALACGYMNVDGATIRLDAYASVHGYVHNGGIIGMDHVHERNLEDKVRGYVKNCTVDGAITFFEDNSDRRAYCRPYIGERSNKKAILSSNETVRFDVTEVTSYDRDLLPETCENPVYTETVVPPTCTAPGYTEYSCAGCGYRYRDAYTLPRHTPGPWVTTKRPTDRTDGERARFCTVCGAVDVVQEIPAGTYPGR